LALEIVDVGFKNLAGRSDLVIPLLYANVLSPLLAAWWLLGRGGAGARWRSAAKPAR
jgi:hypothetical protein